MVATDGQGQLPESLDKAAAMSIRESSVSPEGKQLSAELTSFIARMIREAEERESSAKLDSSVSAEIPRAVWTAIGEERPGCSGVYSMQPECTSSRGERDSECKTP
jgi:hypothetical protein